MNTATNRRVCVGAACLFAALVLVAPTMTLANPLPVWDHYKTYMIGEPPMIQMPFEAVDQFGHDSHATLWLEQLAAPAMKNNEPRSDTLTHYTWWVIDGDEPGRWVVADNQFGEQGLEVHDAVYWLNPALKNAHDITQIPVKNHYKCYDAIGHPVDREVSLTTQFGVEQVTVKEPVVFCNPAKKIDRYGEVFDVVDPDYHLVCYRLEPTHFLGFPVVMWDQFLQEQIHLTHSQWLCVPSLKTDVVQVEESTWGRLKSIYR